MDEQISKLLLFQTIISYSKNFIRLKNPDKGKYCLHGKLDSNNVVCWDSIHDNLYGTFRLSK